MNEETVKNNIIMRYFTSLGFDPSDIEYETSFSIKLGKNAYSIDGAKERAAGRLDILFKRNNENLFIVETKSQGHPIDEADRTQAISYARLLDKISPFAIVTNGIETEIYDVITTERLSSDNLNDSDYVVKGYKVALKPELRYEALKHFIGLNVDNLRAFCQKQIATNMQGIIGNEENKEGKFIPKVFSQRQGIQKVFDSFLMSNKKVFAIVAESGLGKTNAICDLAISYAQTNPVLFFNGSQISGDFLEEIEYEFNWDFSGDRSGIGVIQRIAETLIQFDKDLIIFIDAIDEFPNMNSRLQLNNFIKHCPPRIKLCISCKEAVWPELLTQSGIRSSISCALFVNQEKDNFSFRITPFSPDELDSAIQKYREFFELPIIEGSTKALCSNPLMLRALSEVYSAQSSIPYNLITATVTKTFLDKKLEKSANPDGDKTFLSLFGKFLFELNKELIFEDEMPEHLHVSEFLVDYSVLRRTKDDLGRTLVGFQYDDIRDFVMCFYSLKLDKLPENELVEIIQRNIQKVIPCSVFTYYERIAESGIKNIIRNEFSKYHFKRATEFIDAYQNIINTEFPAIRKLFEPYSGNFGLLALYSLDDLHLQYSFRDIKEGEDRVIWLENKDWDDKKLEPEKITLSIKYKTRGLSWSSHDFTVIEPNEYAKRLILVQLKHLIEHRALYQQNNNNLMIEFILQETRKNAHSWALVNNWQDFSWQKIFPLNLDSTFEKVEASLLQMIATSRSFLQSRGISEYDIEYPPDLLALHYYLEIVRKKQETIDKHLLPFPAKGTIPLLGAEIDKYSDEEIIQYLKTFFTLFLNEYKILVETNFPNITDKLETYRLLPIQVMGEIMKESNHFKGLAYCFLPSKANDVDIIMKGSESIFDLNNFFVKTKTGNVRINRCHSGTAMRVFFYTDMGRENIIQRAVYEALFDDLRELYDLNNVF